MREMRSHMAWYTSGLAHSASIRREINGVETMEGLIDLLDRRFLNGFDLRKRLDNAVFFLYNTLNVRT